MASEIVQLGPFVLDVSRYELTRGGKPVRMERIPMDLLILLVREKGRLVGREEIIERLWGKDVHFDSDNGINTAIRDPTRSGRRPGKTAVHRDGAGQRLPLQDSSRWGDQ